MEENSDFAKNYSLPEEMRNELKKPLGQLIREKPNEEVISLINLEEPSLVIFIGDFCVQQILAEGFTPDISIIDMKNLRKDSPNIIIPNAKVIKANNPPAKITEDAWKKIKQAISSKVIASPQKAVEPIVLNITGEEDLLVFPAVLESPDGAFIIYGQPHEGIVLIKVTANVKFKFKKLIERMKVFENEDKSS